MMWAAIIAACVAILALVVFALRFGSVASDLATSEADRGRLEDNLRELVEDEEKEDITTKARIAQLLKEQDELRAEILRRRRPGDARARLRVLSKASGQAPDPNHQD